MNLTATYQFKPILANIDGNKYLNAEYLDEIVKLFLANWNVLTDDFQQNKNPLDAILQEINLNYPYFYAILTPNNEFMGFCWLRCWVGDGIKTHSCQLQGTIKKEFQGKHTEIAYNQLMYSLFCELNLERLQMEIPQANKSACFLASRLGFKLDGIIRNATKKDGLNINHKLYSILKDEYIERTKI